MLLKKYYHHLIELSDLRLFLIRYGVSLILFFEMIVLPFMLRPDFYTQIELLRNIFLMSPILLCGAHSGYLLIYYNQHKNYKNALFLFAAVSGFFLGFCIFFIFHNFLVSLAVFFMLFCNAIEKVLVVEDRLIWASIYKSTISLCMLAICLCSVIFSFDWSSIEVYAVSVVLGVLLWLLIGFIGVFDRLKIPMRWIDYRLILNRTLVQIRELIAQGFYLNIQTYILFGYFLLDRYFINTAYPTYAAEYAIAYSFSQIIFIALNTVAFSAQRRMGLNAQSMTLHRYNKLLKKIVVLYCVLFLISLVGIFLVSPFLSRYGDFRFSFMIVSIFVGGYYALSSFSILAFYKGLAVKMMLSIFVVGILNVLVSYLFVIYSVHYYINLIKSGFLLVLSAILVHSAIRKVLYEKL